MNSYTCFAEFYDKLMAEDFNYSHIADYVENVFDAYSVDANLVCELACGTGNITIPLAKRGYDMIAVDNSYDMLDIARKKASSLCDNNILFLNQNMTSVDLYGTVDAFICLVDGINYILNPYSLYKMFKKIKTCFLEPDGIFIFDISSEHKLKNVIGNNTFIHDGSDVFYSWENRYIESKRMSDMYLNFFVQNKNGSYRRFSERHLQRACGLKEIEAIVRKAGFKKADIYDGMSFNNAHEESERIVFVVR